MTPTELFIYCGLAFITIGTTWIWWAERKEAREERETYERRERERRRWL